MREGRCRNDRDRAFYIFQDDLEFAMQPRFLYEYLKDDKITGQLSVEDVTTMVLCKPKLLPLKSLTLEKLEKMQQAAQDTIRQQEMAEKEEQQTAH
ncbi:hypothetical protein STEG23_015741 [Scotinomys teguina]